MKQSNKKVSQSKTKRYSKNKKRTQSKPHLSRFERKQAFLREQIIKTALLRSEQVSQ
jgi:hypothetical protein